MSKPNQTKNLKYLARKPWHLGMSDEGFSLAEKVSVMCLLTPTQKSNQIWEQFKASKKKKKVRAEHICVATFPGLLVYVWSLLTRRMCVPCFFGTVWDPVSSSEEIHSQTCFWTSFLFNVSSFCNLPWSYPQYIHWVSMKMCLLLPPSVGGYPPMLRPQQITWMGEASLWKHRRCTAISAASSACNYKLQCLKAKVNYHSL